MKETEITNLIDSHFNQLRQSRIKAATKAAVFVQSFLLLFQIGLGVFFTIAGAPWWLPAVTMCVVSFHLWLVTDAIKRLRKVGK